LWPDTVGTIRLKVKEIFQKGLAPTRPHASVPVPLIVIIVIIVMPARPHASVPVPLIVIIVIIVMPA